MKQLKAELSPGRMKAQEIVMQLRAVMLNANEEDLDYIRDAVLMTLDQEKAFRKKYGSYRTNHDENEQKG